MVNLPKPRKVDKIKKMPLDRLAKPTQQILQNATLPEILAHFQSAVFDPHGRLQEDNHATAKDIRQLLSSLKSLLKKTKESVTWSKEQVDEANNAVVTSLKTLNRIVSDESAFPETIALSALCMTFTLLNFFASLNAKLPSTSAEMTSSNTHVLASCFSYLSYFSSEKDFPTDLSFALEVSDMKSSTKARMTAVFKQMTSTKATVSFREAALTSALLNCSLFHELITEEMIEVFFLLHPLMIRFCSMSSPHVFYIFRLLNQYLKSFYGIRKKIEAYCSQTKESYEQLLIKLISGTLAQIDHDWESPIHGVAQQIREAYKYLIELAKEPAKDSLLLRQLLGEQFQQALSLPFTCKSKYRKLAILLQCLASETVDATWFGSGGVQFAAATFAQAQSAKLCQLPFLVGEQPDSFATQVVHHLSINTLANAVAEFYKASVGAICTAYQGAEEAEEEKLNQATSVWSTCWLQALTSIFTGGGGGSGTSSSAPSLSESPIIQNALVAHLLPFTLTNVPGSLAILLTAFRRHPYGQIAVVRICLERCSTFIEASALPSSAWLLELLADGDERTRAEALALLVDERLVGRGGGPGQTRQAARPLLCRLVARHFVRANLNIDSAPFRQRVICRLEAFYAKVITSVVDRIGAAGKQISGLITELSPTDQEVVGALRETLDLLAVSVFPGSCYQRKFTALSLFSAIISAVEKEDRADVFARCFCQLLTEQPKDDASKRPPPPASWMTLLLLGLVDKDDKIRRLSTEVLIEFGNSRLFAHLTHSLPQLQPLKMNEQLANLAQLFSNSPRHQETHLSGLLEKLPHHWALSGVKGERRTAMQALFWTVKRKVDEVSADFGSLQSHRNLLWTAKCRPLHGVLLQLNHLLPLLAFSEVLLLKTEDVAADRLAFCRALLASKEKEAENTAQFCFPVRAALLQPCIRLTLDVIEFFVDLLTPKSGNEELSGDGEPMDITSPSFLEMGQAIESIISRGRKDGSTHDQEDTKDDVSTSNDFALLMSLSWLNIKECTFLLTTITALFADLLSLVVHVEEETNETVVEDQDNLEDLDFLVTADELLAMGSKIVSVMLRSRHKGVIEASGVALSRFTRTLLRIQCLLAQKEAAGSSGKQMLRGRRLANLKKSCSGALEAFVERLLSAIDTSSSSSSGGDNSSFSTTSITRRSAGLAFIVQSVLVGEADAIDLDGLRPIVGGSGEQCTSSSSSLYERVINLLVSLATSPISPDWQAQKLVDLPQANALHILQAIVDTSALAPRTAKTVEQLFPLCVAGFTSPHWPLRNASLTLFGACTTRMLGQKKRIKALDVAASESSEVASVEGEHLGAGFGTTITFGEFSARYPSLVAVIEGHFAACQQQQKSPRKLHPELVPVLALLASFTPIGETIVSTADLSPVGHQLPSYLTAYLSNRIWKVRLLAARALATLWSTSQLEHHLFQQLQLNEHREATAKVDGNTAHGLLCLADTVLQLKSRAFTPQMAFYRQRLSRLFSGILLGRQGMLSQIGHSVMHPAEFGSEVLMSDVPEEREDDQEEEEEEEKNSSESGSRQLTGQLLLSTLERVNFKRSDDIRLRAAEQLRAVLQSSEAEEIQRELLLHSDGTSLAGLVRVLLTLLEDEDRDVRQVGQTLVGLAVTRLDLLDAFPLYRTRPVLNQTASLDVLFRLISHQLALHPRRPLSPAAEEPLFSHLLRWLLHSSHLAREDTAELSAVLERNSGQLKGREKVTEDDREEDAVDIVLFEREQKNVFAEPYAMAIRVGAYLAAETPRHLPLLECALEGAEGKRLAASCQRLDELVKEECGLLLLQTLMSLSIWKLPDFLVRVVSLAEVLEMLADCDLLKWSFLEEALRCLQAIRRHFPFLETLRRQVLKSDEDDALLSLSASPTIAN